MFLGSGARPASKADNLVICEPIVYTFIGGVKRITELDREISSSQRSGCENYCLLKYYIV
jgi:hypothetical protein